jgi:hypothetical protein
MEVQSKLEPLRAAVEAQGRTLRSLYSNGSGGPPGYLENAREEDKEWKDQMFDKLDNFLNRLDAVERFIVAHDALEKNNGRRLNTKLVVIGIVISAISVLSANIASCRSVAKSLLSDPNHSTLQAPQNSQMREDYHPEESK